MGNQNSLAAKGLCVEAARWTINPAAVITWTLRQSQLS
jgi:hypothetical protein